MSSFVYVTYIRATPEKVWEALTNPEQMKLYWGAYAQCDWKVGSPWSLTLNDGRLADTGEILESDPPRRLVIRWRNEFMPDMKAEGYSRCTIEIAPAGEAVKLTISHEMDHTPSPFINAVSTGWPGILSSLKSLLETGTSLNV